VTAEATCPRCGRPVRWVLVDGEMTMLDTVPTVDGRYRLDGDDINRAERIDRPGHTGFQLHAETCTGP
jgi:hypothetical protein